MPESATRALSIGRSVAKSGSCEFLPDPEAPEPKTGGLNN